MILTDAVYAFVLVILIIAAGVMVYRLVGRNRSADSLRTAPPPRIDDSPLRAEDPQSRTDPRPDRERKRST